jgi:hypothetical protein
LEDWGFGLPKLIARYSHRVTLRFPTGRGLLTF